MLLLAAPTQAIGAPDESSLEQVVTALDVSRQPSDYVVVVDTSGSMKIDNRYSKVRAALDALLKALRADDRVSLVTFDTTAKVRFRGEIGDDPLAVLRSLPATPEGKLTDIGAGLSAGIGELEKPGAKGVGAIVLITDGKLDTAADSPYRKVGSAAWKQLGKRAEAVSTRHQIAAYAIALESTADAALLKKAFPNAEDIPAKAIDERLAELDSALVRFQASQILQSDLGHGIETTWAGALTHLSDTATSGRAEVTLRSTYEHIPVQVNSLTLASEGGPTISAAPLPEAIDLAPGESVTVPVHFTYTGSGSGQLRLSGDVTSPWEKVMTGRLGLTFEPALESQTDVAVATTLRPPSWLTPGLMGAGAAIAGLLAALLGFRMTRPRLVGSLAVTRDGTVLDEFILTGRSLPLHHGSNSARSPLKGIATAVVKRGSDKTQSPGVRVTAQVGGEKVKGTLFDGQSLSVGGLRVTYTSARTRMMSMINHQKGGSE